jgi:hypothetical protein
MIRVGPFSSSTIRESAAVATSAMPCSSSSGTTWAV